MDLLQILCECFLSGPLPILLKYRAKNIFHDIIGNFVEILSRQPLSKNHTFIMIKDDMSSLIWTLKNLVNPAFCPLKVRGPFVQTLCIEKDSYMDAI